MDSKQRRAVVREMARLGIPNATVAIQATPEKALPSLSDSLLAFVEQPLFLAAFGVLGGIMGLIYTPFLALTGICIVAAFHRANVVKGRSWKIQIPSYVLIFAGAVAIVYLANDAIRKSVKISTAPEIAENVAKLLPHSTPSSTVTNIYETYAQPEPNKRAPRIELSSFDLASQEPDGSSRWQTTQNNAGDDVALDVMADSKGLFLPKSKVAEDFLFSQIKVDPNASGVADQPPGLKNAIYAPLDIGPPSEIEKLDYTNHLKVLYLGRVVLYSDNSGNKYRTELCEFVWPGYHLRNMCAGHNTTRILKRQR